MSVMLESILKLDPLDQRTDLIAIARSGIKTKHIKSIQKYTTLTDKELVAILPISQRQLIRYEDSHVLNKEITAHLIQLIELFQKGYHLFGTEKFNIWIRTANKVLSNYLPIEIMDTSIGIEMIEDLIGRIEHGVYS